MELIKIKKPKRDLWDVRKEFKIITIVGGKKFGVWITEFK